MFPINISMFYLPMILTFHTGFGNVHKGFGMVSNVNKEVDKIDGWLCMNKLSINLTKINFMLQ